MEKVRSKLNGWDAKRLSLAGRITLVKFVLLALPNYLMGMVWIPVTICWEIKKIVRSFIWGFSFFFAPKPTIFAWEECCHPIERGGLGLRSLVDQNKVFLLKLGFQILSNTKSLWVQILKSKYRVVGIIPRSIARTNYSFVWRSLSKVWSEVISNVIWSIGDGRLVNFWNDPWVNIDQPLKDFCFDMSLMDLSLRVCDVTNSVGEWDWERLRRWLPRGILKLIAVVIPPQFSGTLYQLIWQWSVSDKFSSKVTYINLYQDRSLEPASH